MPLTEFVKHTADKHVEIMTSKDNRKYQMQLCQDDTINEGFRQLHHDLVNTIIQFCVKYDIIVDEFSLYADGLEDSIKHGQWCPSTDSCFIMGESLQREHHEPFLYSI